MGFKNIHSLLDDLFINVVIDDLYTLKYQQQILGDVYLPNIFRSTIFIDMFAMPVRPNFPYITKFNSM